MLKKNKIDRKDIKQTWVSFNFIDNCEIKLENVEKDGNWLELRNEKESVVIF